MDDNSSADHHNQGFNWKICGKAGEGVMTTADTLARVAHRHGLQTFTYFEYPSLIKGGHQTGQVFAHRTHASCHKKHLDLLIALDQQGIELHQDEITPDTIIIAEPLGDKYDIAQYSHLTPHIFAIELTQIARATTGSSLASNTVALAVSAHFLGLDPEEFFTLIRTQFAKKGAEVVEKNLAAFSAGLAAAQAATPAKALLAKTDTGRLLLSGSEAVGAGAIAAGLQLYAAYPMSPSSNVFHYVAAQQDQFPLVVRHAEDEIAAINLAIGASIAGARAMTGSAGGGFALMVEALSLTGVMETPLVIMVAQRPGPATGLPTWTGQGDLQFVIRAGHGEFLKIVLTPGDTAEHFVLTRHAFYLAEKYQLPVIILTDKYLLESMQTMPMVDTIHTLERHSMIADSDLPADDSYRRYADAPSGISPRSVPGQAHGLSVTNSYEHDTFGYATEDAATTIQQVEKRARKKELLAAELPQPYLIGPAEADVTCVGWGSTLSVMQQLIAEQAQPSTTNHQSPSINYLHIPCAWPFPVDQFSTLASSTKKLVMIEGNREGQMEQLIRQETGIQCSDHYRRYDGRPLYTQDIQAFVRTIS